MIDFEFEPLFCKGFVTGCILTTFIIIAGYLLWTFQGDNRLYSLDHCALNLGALQSNYMNMGYWKDIDMSNKDGSQFSKAAKALVHKLAETAQVKKGNKILDLGCGCGDSLIEWIHTFHASECVGVTSDPDQYRMAKSVLENLNKDSNATVYCQDAVSWLEEEAQELRDCFDHIIAVDSSYHFNTRHDMLKAGKLLLVEDGRITLVDVVPVSDNTNNNRPLPIRLLHKLILNLVYFFASMPRQNMISVQERRQELQDLGYQEIQVQDITQHVFEPLAAYLQSRLHLQDQLRYISAIVRPGILHSYAYFAKFLQWAVRNNLLSFVVISAKKPKTKDWITS